MTWDNELVGPLPSDELRREVIRMGELGWELVNAYCTGPYHFAAMRRPAKIAVRQPVVEITQEFARLGLRLGESNE